MQKRIMKLLILLSGIMPTMADATLLGRVNSYYDPARAKVVQEAKSELDEAEAYLKKVSELDEEIALQLERAKRNLKLRTDKFKESEAAVNYLKSKLAGKTASNSRH